MVAPFPWSGLARVDRRSSRLVTALAAWLPRHGVHPGDSGSYVIRRRGGGVEVSRGGVHLGADLGIDRVEVTTTQVLAGPALDAQLSDPTAGVARLRVGAMRGFVVVPGRLVRAIAQRVLGGPNELDAPRPLTTAERAVVVVAVAAVARDLGAAVELEPCELGGPQVPAAIGGEAAVVEVTASGTEVGTVSVVLPITAVVTTPRRPLTELAAPWLAEIPVTVSVSVARAVLDRTALGRLRVRDVLIATPIGRKDEVDLRVARGGVHGALAPATGRVTVLTTYSRNPTRPMDETLAEDTSLEVAITIGDVRMSVRALLELRPGQVLELGAPLGGPVELRIGARVLGRGELVDVDGELGVRVLSIENPLSAGPPAC